MVGAIPEIQFFCFQNRFHRVSSILFQLPPQKHGGEVDEQGQQHQNGGDGEGHRRLAPFVGVDIQSHRQRGGGGMQGRKKIVEHQTEAGGVQQRRAFPHDPAHGLSLIHI